MVWGILARGVAALARPLLARAAPKVMATFAAKKSLPKVVTGLVVSSKRFIGYARTGLNKLVGGSKVAVQKSYQAKKSPLTSGLINAAITGAALGAPILGAAGAALVAGRGRRIKAAVIGGAIGAVVKRATSGLQTPAITGESPLTKGIGGIIKNEQTSIPHSQAQVRAAARKAAPSRRRARRRVRRVRRGRRGRRVTRRLVARRRTRRARKRETWGPKHKRGRRYKGKPTGHGRHGRVSFTTKDGRKVNFTAHRRRK